MLGNKAINTLLSMDYLHEAPFILIYTIALPLSALVSIHFSSDFSEKNSAIQGKEFQRPEEATPTQLCSQTRLLSSCSMTASLHEFPYSAVMFLERLLKTT